VPVSGPSLSQELVEARWRLELMPVQGPDGDGISLPSPEAWQAATAALRASASWIWHDTDKKGRPRSRECRPDLLDLTLRMAGPDLAEIAYSAAIDPAGRSLRPEQLQHWFEQHLGQPLALIRLCRESLRLGTVEAAATGPC
jgi:hypothetical protein